MNENHQKIKFNRRLKYKNFRKTLTVCIASICESDYDPKVLLCADRLITAGIQFESGSSKIRHITPNCYSLHASEDSLFSEKIVERVKNQLQDDQVYSVKEIVDFFAEECISLKRERQEKEIISKYNFVAEKTKADPNQMISTIVNELEYLQYPEFEFIVAGMDETTPHLFKINQDGEYSNWDTLGFVTTGTGQNLAFPEMTKWYYSTKQSMTLAIPRIYFAKKVSERVQGVGRITDLAFMCFREDPNTKEMFHKVYDVSVDEGFMERLDNAVEKLQNNEAEIITELANDIQKEIDNAHKTDEIKS